MVETTAIPRSPMSQREACPHGKDSNVIRRGGSSPAIAVTDPNYVLCSHGYMREGWCAECPAQATRTEARYLSRLLYLSVVLVLWLIVTYLVDPTILVALAALLYLAIVAILALIVVRHEHDAGAIFLGAR